MTIYLSKLLNCCTSCCQPEPDEDSYLVIPVIQDPSMDAAIARVTGSIFIPQNGNSSKASSPLASSSTASALNGTSTPASERYTTLGSNPPKASALSNTSSDSQAEGSSQLAVTATKVEESWSSCFENELAFPAYFEEGDLLDAQYEEEGVEEWDSDEDLSSVRSTPSPLTLSAPLPKEGTKQNFRRISPEELFKKNENGELANPADFEGYTNALIKAHNKPRGPRCLSA